MADMLGKQTPETFNDNILLTYIQCRTLLCESSTQATLVADRDAVRHQA